MEIQNIGNEKFVSVLNDPFKKSHVNKILVWFQEDYNKLHWTANGIVEFRNGKTEGKQSFVGKSFDEVVVKIKQFIQTELK